MRQVTVRIMLMMLIVFCSSSGMSSFAAVGNGELSRFHIQSKHISERDITVWLPSGYDPDRHYAVLYMNDGQNLFDSSITWNQQEWQVDESISRLTAQDSIQPLIVVAIPNSGEFRRAEYFPEAVVDSISEPWRSEMLDIMPGGPRADSYLRFLVEELKPRVDSMFTTLADQPHTYICGSSTGALNALYALCEYPQVFHGAACLSTHWTGIPTQNAEIPRALRSYLKAKLPSPRNHRVYFDHGAKGLDANYAPHQLEVDAIMRGIGYTSENWITRTNPEWDHNERSWAKRFPVAVAFLIRR